MVFLLSIAKRRILRCESEIQLALFDHSLLKMWVASKEAVGVEDRRTT